GPCVSVLARFSVAIRTAFPFSACAYHSRRAGLAGAPTGSAHSRAGAFRPGTRPSALSRVVQEQVPDRGRVDTGHALRRGRQVIVEVREDDRRLVEQQRLDLPGDAALGGQIEGRDVL